jgi:hypothetical protein
MNAIPLSFAVAFAAPLAGLPALARAAGEPVGAFDPFPEGAPVCAVPPADAQESALGYGTSLRGPGTPRLESGIDGARDVRTLRWLGIPASPVSEDLPLRIEEGTVGLTIRADARSPGWRVAVELLGESGEVLYCDGCEGTPAVGESRRGRGTVQMPSTDRPGWELVPGLYSFRVRATSVAAGSPPGGVLVDVLAALRSDAAVDVEHVLDLNFVYTPGCMLSAAVADTSARFAELLGLADEWLLTTGIRLGRVTHVDLDRADFDSISTWAEAGDMFRTSADLGRPRALNVYCVRWFSAPLNPVVGLSGGIPGPLLNGTQDSGIAIRTVTFWSCSNCLGAFASLLSHEIGHYLGLYHTSSADVSSWDPFSDTPECHNPEPPEPPVFPYGCGDFANVMFPLIHSANTEWSPGQARVVPTHPIVQTVPVVRRMPVPPAAPGPVVGPNPFESEVRLAVPGRTIAAAAVYDVAGRVVRLLRGTSGDLVWDGRAGDGRAVPAGIYFARITEADGSASTVRLVRSR